MDDSINNNFLLMFSNRSVPVQHECQWVLANLAAQIAGKAVSANDDVNMGQSSNDVIPTAIHVSAVMECQKNFFLIYCILLKL